MSFVHSPKIVTDGLVLALDAGNTKSYPGSGTTWFDLSGNNNHFTLYNSPTFNSSKYFTFDGIDDYARSTATLNLSLYRAITVLIWFQPLSYPSSGILDFIYEHTNNFNNNIGGFVHTYNDTSLGQDYQIFLSNKGNAGYNLGVWNKTLFNNLTWKHSSAIIDTNQLSVENTLYVNGDLTTALSNPVPGYAANNTNTFANDYFYVGTRGGATFFSDLNISGIQIYNRALSASEIQQNFNATRGRYGI
jgi:hypothetical protein